MLYAIVDIETTGSYAAGNGITEIGIVIHDGIKVLNFYETLVNPNLPIPFFIQRLTGINNEMVANAPSFCEIAGHVFELLQDKIFVAHNVNFDYSFVKAHLAVHGYELESKKLCTVRLARKVLPGLAGYSLGKLTTILGINHTQHHRAGGDALATADLLALIIARDTEGVINDMLKGRNSEQYLPAHLPIEELDKLPPTPGVYYFLNAAGKTIYIGKAKNIRKRVKSHFSNNKIGKQKQDFLRETFRISYKECATELMANILESAEIRRLWPIHNRSQKGFLPQFALLTYEDRQGYLRIAIEKNKNGLKPIYTFNTLTEGQQRLRELIDKFGLCIKLCNVVANIECTCTSHLIPDEYNIKVNDAINWIKKQLPTFAIIDKGIEDNENSCILMMDGNLYGMGFINDKKVQLQSVEILRQNLEPLKDNDYIRNLVYRYANEYPEKCVLF